jgi:copper chaperone
MLQLQVRGMTCGHCAAAVRQAVASVAPGAEVQVDVATGRVAVRGTDRVEAVAAAIREAGYEVGEPAPRRSGCACCG